MMWQAYEECFDVPLGNGGFDGYYGEIGPTDTLWEDRQPDQDVDGDVRESFRYC